METWTRIYPNSREVWALPACNPGGNFELTLGGGRAWTDGARTTDDYVIQAKTLLRPLETNAWGIGLAAGTVRHPENTPGPNQLGNSFAYIPVSASFLDDKFVMHWNAGWLRDRAKRQDKLTWGMGSEFQLNERWMGIAEIYGDNQTAPYWQTGFRYAILPNLWQIDTTVGQQVNGPKNAHWLSIGIRLTPEKMF
jgi:hypothetical protein